MIDRIGTDMVHEGGECETGTNGEVHRGLRGHLKPGKRDAKGTEASQLREPSTGGNHNYSSRENAVRREDPHSLSIGFDGEGWLIEAQDRTGFLRKAKQCLDRAIREDPAAVG